MPVAGGSEGLGQDPDSGVCTFQASAAERAARGGLQVTR